MDDSFDYFTTEYSQALQAYQAIEAQSATLLLMGHAEELRGFVVQFIEMAARVRDLAREHNEPNFAEWFDELVQKATRLKDGVPQ